MLVQLTSGAERPVVGLAWVLPSPVQHLSPGEPRTRLGPSGPGGLPCLLPTQPSPLGSSPWGLLCWPGLLGKRLLQELAPNPGRGEPRPGGEPCGGHRLCFLSSGGLAAQQAEEAEVPGLFPGRELSTVPTLPLVIRAYRALWAPHPPCSTAVVSLSEGDPAWWVLPAATIVSLGAG